MRTYLQKLFEGVSRAWADLSFRTARRVVGAVRYQPRRLTVTGGAHVPVLPDEVSPPAGKMFHDLDDAIDRFFRRVGERAGADTEALVRWFSGAATGAIDALGAATIDDLVLRNRLGPGALTPHVHEVGVLVLDMRGFSRLTVALDDSQYLTDRIGEYLTEMTRVVEQHRGIVFDYTGDGLLAVFLPELVRKRDHALVEHLAGPIVADLHGVFGRLAVRWREEWLESGRQGAEIGLGVGITYGPATIGLMGPVGKKFFGVVGPPVNLAAYLCSQALPGTALIDQESFRRVGAVPPPGHKTLRLKSEKLHQRIETVRVRPEPRPAEHDR